MAVSCLLDKDDIDFPDVVVVVADVENLKQNLYLFTQIRIWVYLQFLLSIWLIG